MVFAGINKRIKPCGLKGFQLMCRRLESPIGEMPEWSNGAVSKTVERYAFRGFESLSLRHLTRKLPLVFKTL